MLLAVNAYSEWFVPYIDFIYNYTVP